MSGFCDLNSSQCLNNGKCVLNDSSDMTYCHCVQCYFGTLCESHAWRQGTYNTTYTFLIVYIITLCISVLNNLLVFELLMFSKRIRRTNYGIYLILYSTLSLISSILLVTDNVVQYYPNSLFNNISLYDTFHCYTVKIGNHMLTYLCIWFSSFIVFEHSLIVGFEDRISINSRWRSLVTILVTFLIAIGCTMPMFIHKCDWENIPYLQTLRGFYTWFYPAVGIIIYILGTILLLYGFSRRIRRYETENSSFLKTYFKLLKRHLFIFIPPIAYVIGYAPFQLINLLQNPSHSYYQCGISLAEYIIKVLIEAVYGLPVVLSWLLFVFPSRVYMNEYYLHTWSGQCLAKMLLLCKSQYRVEQSGRLSTMNLIDIDDNTMETPV